MGSLLRARASERRSARRRESGSVRDGRGRGGRNWRIGSKALPEAVSAAAEMGRQGGSSEHRWRERRRTAESIGGWGRRHRSLLRAMRTFS